MPQYITHPFLQGAAAGQQTLMQTFNNEAEAKARNAQAEAQAQYAAYQQQAAETSNRNKAIQDILMSREYLRMGLNPKTGDYDAKLATHSKTFGGDIVRKLYETYLGEGNVMPGSPATAPTQIIPGGRSRILPFAILPDVPPAYAPVPPYAPNYQASTLPSIQAGTYQFPPLPPTRD